MKKFILGVLSGLGAVGVGKLVYEKGRRDQSRDLKHSFEQLSIGIKMGEDLNNSEESE